jgi:hypothetical protein
MKSHMQATMTAVITAIFRQIRVAWRRARLLKRAGAPSCRVSTTKGLNDIARHNRSRSMTLSLTEV